MHIFLLAYLYVLVCCIWFHCLVTSLLPLLVTVSVLFSSVFSVTHTDFDFNSYACTLRWLALMSKTVLYAYYYQFFIIHTAIKWMGDTFNPPMQVTINYHLLKIYSSTKLQKQLGYLEMTISTSKVKWRFFFRICSIWTHAHRCYTIILIF